MSMKLEQQVICLSLAKRLKELGVKQESHFWWVELKEETINPMLKTGMDRSGRCHNYAAFTVAELFNLMPMTYASVEQHSNNYRAGWKKNGLGEEYGRGDTPAEALGLMLAYLIENGLITL